MSRIIDVSDTISLVPSGYDSANSHYSSVSSSYPISNGYDGTSSTNYAYITCNTGSQATTYISYTFNVSAIPAEATIDSIVAKAKLRVSSTQYISTAVVQLYSGSTAKGSSVSARTTSASTYTISSPGSWTRSELSNIEIRYTGKRGTSSTTRAAYLYFYGADLDITYSISGVAYTITAASSASEISVSPATQELMEGDDGEVRFDGSSIDGVTVTDNGTDVTDQLVSHEIELGGTVQNDLGSYTLVSGSFNGSGASYFSGLVGNGENASKTTSNYYSGGSGTIAVFTYDMAFTEIPSNATITRVYCNVNGHAESTSNSSEYMCAQLISGSTEITEELNFKSIGTSNSTQTLEATTLPTISQLANLKLQCRLGYYGGAINGATCYVTYTVPDAGGIYWIYTISNISADHTIIVEEAGPFIPPDEDPTKTYYPITISSINALTSPGSGTERVESGTTQVVTISPTDPQLTLALDNGVDITNQLVGGTPQNNYTVATAPGASYGFNYNSSTGYYVSTNNGVSKSASVARISLDLESDVLITINYINYAEAQYDYGLFGKVDTTVATDGLTAASGGSSPSDSASNYQYICSSAADSTTTVKTITYQVTAGTHYIDIKYGKDDASDSGNDSLQWKIVSVEATSAGGDYTYTLTNVTQKHSLIFVFGDVDYYFVTASGNSSKLYPDGQSVRLAGQGYELIVVPDYNSATLTVTDNGTDVTSSVTTETTTNPRTGATVINYIYKIAAVNAAHTIVVQLASSTGAKVYLKINGIWTLYSSVYVKANGVWVRQADVSSAFSSGVDYVKGEV